MRENEFQFLWRKNLGQISSANRGGSAMTMRSPSSLQAMSVSAKGPLHSEKSVRT